MNAIDEKLLNLGHEKWIALGISKELRKLSEGRYDEMGVELSKIANQYLEEFSKLDKEYYELLISKIKA